jgi:DNA polymerase-4
MGIKNGVSLREAKKICPDITVVESEPRKYREVNRRFNKIFSEYTDRIEPYSIDESFLDLSESRKNPLQVGLEIKKRLKTEVGEWLTCSIGIAPNKFMAKLAADLQKPDGLTVVWREHLPQIYKTLRLSDLWGVARGWERRLAKLGIFSPYDVLHYPLSNLVAAFGKPGFYIWQRINGLEIDDISSEEDPPKSFGHSWVLNFRTTDKKRLGPVIMRLAEKAARRMRAENFRSRGIYLYVRMVDGTGFHRSKKLEYDIETGQELYDEALIMWGNWHFHAEVMHIAVGFTYLTVRNHQTALFGRNIKALNDSFDKINDKYGEFTVRSGLLAHTKDYAPDAIAFGK